MNLLAVAPSFFDSTGAGLLHSEFTPLLAITALVVCLCTLISTNFGLSILVFSMLLSPEIEVAQLPQRAVTIRVEDFLIGIVFFTWLAKMAILKEVGLIRRSILNRAILLYIAAFTVSTLIAMNERQFRGLGSQFFILKYFEYFVIFFMFFNNVTSKKQVQRFLVFFCITGLCVCLYALSIVGKYSRLGAPFEGDHPEPGSLGGYLLVLLSVLFGFLLHGDWPRHRILLVGLLFLALVTLVLSTSRGALLAFIPFYLTVLFISPRHRTLLVAAFFVCVLVGYQFVPPRIVQFTLQAFQVTEAGGKAYQVGGREVEVGPSGEARVESWKYVFALWRKKPLLGHGVSGVGIVDSQFVRTLGEVGVVGLLIFIWLLRLIYREAIAAFRNPDPFLRGLGASLILANTALIAQGVTANSYIIVRIMEPFWFLVAVTLGLTQLTEEETAGKKKEGLKVA